MARRLTETLYFVRNMDDAIQFYTQQVGFAVDERFDWGFPVLTVDGDNRLGLVLESEWEREYPDEDELPRPRIAIQTDDFHAELYRLQNSGVPIGTIKGEKGKRQSVTFFDPDENPVFLWADPEEKL